MTRRTPADRWEPERDKHRRARALRRRATEAERVFWSALRGRQLTGHKLRRQVPIAQYIADFCFVEQRLVVELDGAYHDDDAQRRYDQERDAAIAARGYRVLRFTNAQVLGDLPGVLATVAAALSLTHPRLAALGAPSLSRRAGEGGGRGEGEG